MCKGMKKTPEKELFTKTEWKPIEKLRTPAQVQRFLSAMPYNWERNGSTLRSFREVIKRNEAHCLEAAVAAAGILEQHREAALLLGLAYHGLIGHMLLSFQPS